MGSTFGGISTALSALYAQRRALEVTGQNIANANTDGYSRQQVDLASLGGATSAGRYAVSDGSGVGVQVLDVSRSRDEIMETRARTEHSQDAYLAGQKQLYGDIETAIGEPSDTGLQSQFSQFWTSMQDVANNPGDPAARTAMLAHAATTADSLRTSAQRLDSLFAANREQLDGYVVDVNDTANTVAQLNDSIVSAQAAALPTNELLDHRDQLVLHLSEMTGGTAVRRQDGSVDFMINGSQLISGNSVRQLQATGATSVANQATDPVKIAFTDNGALAASPSGTLAASVEGLAVTLPKYSAMLDATAATLAASVNTQHKAGFDLDGAPGTDLFTGNTAMTLTVAISDPRKVAASSSATQTLDGSNADAMGGMAKDPAGPDAYYRKFVVDLGVAAQSANRRADIQTTVTQEVDAARTAQSGVNLDEEMTNMLTFQRGYEAAAQAMKAVNDTLETLMNSIGR